jgi:hypothetical protein
MEAQNLLLKEEKVQFVFVMLCGIICSITHGNFCIYQSTVRFKNRVGAEGADLISVAIVMDLHLGLLSSSTALQRTARTDDF